MTVVLKVAVWFSNSTSEHIPKRITRWSQRDIWHLYAHVHSIVHNRPKYPSLDESRLETQHLKNWDHGSRSHHFMADRSKKSGNSDRFIFLGSEITVDRDCSHEIKRCLLFRKKAMTNLDIILKSRDITLLTEVKAIAFPGIMYSCEIWTIKKAECWRIDGFLNCDS